MRLFVAIILMFGLLFTSTAQQNVVPTKAVRIADESTVFNQNITVGTVIYCVATNKLYVAKNAVAGTSSLGLAGNDAFVLLGSSLTETEVDLMVSNNGYFTWSDLGFWEFEGNIISYEGNELITAGDDVLNLGYGYSTTTVSNSITAINAGSNSSIATKGWVESRPSGSTPTDITSTSTNSTTNNTHTHRLLFGGSVNAATSSPIRGKEIYKYSQGREVMYPNREWNPQYHSGSVIRIPCTPAIGYCKLVYVSSNGKISVADADLSYTMPAIGISTDSYSAGSNGCVILTDGYLTNTGWNLTAGGRVYVGLTGSITQTEPSGTGDQVQAIGVAMDNNTIKFDFDSTVIEIE
jgi:hypothetical protein